jgi:ABC-type bacteriocin/lantibiotic exporter with double-glycine peptidase domain
MLGFGPQSLSNLIELLILGTLSIVAGYIKVFLVDPYYAESSRNTYLVMVFLVLAAILLRKFMPLLPE